MFSNFSRLVLLIFLPAFTAVAALASPADSKLLALVPAGAQFVAGIENPHHPPEKGWLLLLTRKTSLDLQDWIALSSVDPHRRVDEIIEVAASLGGKDLSEHLVLLAGPFDQKLIYHSALANGASPTGYGGQSVLAVKPFPREKEEMSASRWLVILDNRMAIFGSPELVRRALDRYRSRSGPDPLLAQHLRELHPDVSSWNVLAMSAAMFARNVESEQLHAPWTHVLDGADEFTFGIHYGSTDRIDFAIHTVSSHKASSLAAALIQPRMMPVELSASMRTKLQNLSVEQSLVRGSFLVPARQIVRLLASDPARESYGANSPLQP